jgi:hypothetical protein
MNRRILPGIAAVALLILSLSAGAAPLAVAEGDTVQKVLQGQAGKRVTIRVRAGDELSGTVRSVNADVVHIGELAGREFFDAVIPLKSIDAVIVRVKDQ